MLKTMIIIFLMMLCVYIPLALVKGNDPAMWSNSVKEGFVAISMFIVVITWALGFIFSHEE